MSALVPYKRLEVAIEACRLARMPLTLVGQGPEEQRLRQFAEGSATRFLGWRSDEEIRSLYQSAAVVLLPGTEDFGIVPVEAQACGTPVIALGQGGALETVVPGKTGALVTATDAAMFADAVHQVVAAKLDRGEIRRHAERFSAARFKTAFAAVVNETPAPPAAAS